MYEVSVYVCPADTDIASVYKVEKLVHHSLRLTFDTDKFNDLLFDVLSQYDDEFFVISRVEIKLIEGI